MTVLAALAIGLALTAVGFLRAEQQRQLVVAERDRAQENLALARRLVSDVIQPAAVRMSNFPYAQAYQFEVLEQARTFYEQILRQAGNDPETRREMAQIHCSLGKLARDTGGDAEPALTKSVSMLEDLVTESPDNPEFRYDLADARAWLSIWYQADLRLAEAVTERQRSHALFTQLVEDFPSSERYADALALSNVGLGRRLVGASRFDEAEPYFLAALKADGQLVGFPTFDEPGRVCLSADQACAVRRSTTTARRSVADRRAQNGCHRDADRRRLGVQPLPLGRLPPGARPAGLVHRPLRSRRTASPRRDRSCRQADRRVSAAVWPQYQLGSCRHDLAEVLTATRRFDEAEAARRESVAAWSRPTPRSPPHSPMEEVLRITAGGTAPPHGPHRRGGLRIQPTQWRSWKTSPAAGPRSRSVSGS